MVNGASRVHHPQLAWGNCEENVGAIGVVNAVGADATVAEVQVPVNQLGQAQVQAPGRILVDHRSDGAVG